MQRSKPPLHVFGRPFYAKVAGASFALGACIELFMLKTGFYNTCALTDPARAAFAPRGWLPLSSARALRTTRARAAACCSRALRIMRLSRALG